MVFTQTIYPVPRAYTHGFLENGGQIKDQNGKPNLKVKYILTVAPGMNLLLNNNGFSYDTYILEDTIDAHRKGKSYTNSSNTVKHSKVRFYFHRVDIYLLNANKEPRIIPEEELPCFFNFPGDIKVHSYKRIVYKDIYPNIDLIFDAASATAEYNFIIRPGGDPHKIAMQFKGATHTHLNGNQIQIQVDKGEWNEQLPSSYTDSNKVSASYKIVASDTYGFEIGNYDQRKILTIDPTPDLIWGTYLGGDLNDWGYATAADASGNIFLGGSTNNPGIATSGAFKTTLDGFSDAMVGKFTNDGKPLWITYYGGENEDDIKGLAIDQNNNIIAVGYTFSYSNIATPGSYKTTKVSPNGDADAFIAKFTGDGALLWATYYGGDSLTYGSGVVVDNNNNIFIAGWTTSANGISTVGVYQTVYGGGTGTTAEDGCVAKFSPDGNIIWSTYYGDDRSDSFFGIAIDKDENLYLSGETASLNKISSAGSFQPVFGGGPSDVFLVKFSNNGSRIWSTYYGGVGEDWTGYVCTDGLNNVFVCGNTNSQSGISTPNGSQPSFGGAVDCFIAKFNMDGKLLWGTYYGGSSQDFAYDIASDQQNNIYICGQTGSQNNISTPGSYQPSNSSSCAFIASFDNSGARLWGTYYGKNGPYGGGQAFGITTYGGYAFVSGETTNTENIATCDAYQKTWANNQDAFLAKFGPDIITSLSIISNPDGPICAGSFVNFTASPLNPGNDPIYQWYWNGNPAGTDSLVYTNNQLSAMDSVRCTISKSVDCTIQAISSNSIIVHIDPALPVSVSITGPADSICKGEKVIFTATPTNGGTNPSFQWLVNSVDANIDSAVFIDSNLVNGDIVNCIVIHNNACTVDSIGTSNTIELNVKSIVAPSITISSDNNPVCTGTPVVFNASILNAGANPSEAWQINGITVEENSLQDSITTLKNGDQIDCILTTSVSGCSLGAIQSNLITETILPAPVITITGDSIITKGSADQLQSGASGNINSKTWSPSSSLNFSDIWNPIATPEMTTMYTINVTADNGCVASKNFTVVVITKIMIPNAFTPNGDGKNELFRPIYGSDISDVLFTIYNRWGQLIFQDKGTHKGWDGNLGGEPQPEGAYVWEFRYKTNSGESKILSGTVLLIK